MRTISFLMVCALVFPATTAFGQSTAEVEKAMKQANELLKAQNYVEAYKELEKAKAEIQKLVSAQLEKVFPATSGDFALVKEQNAASPAGIPPPLGLPGASNNVSVTKTYEKATQEAKKDSMPSAHMYMQPRMIVTVSNDTFPINNINMTHNDPAASPGIPGEEVKATQIKGFKAVTRFNSGMKMAGVSILTGKGTVQVHGMQVDALETLLKLVEAMDLNKIAEVFGKK